MSRIISYEYIRTFLKGLDKFDLRKNLAGKLFAIQDVREIGRLHTKYPGQRCELDYTKYGIWLFPDEKWNEPLLYFDGLGIDHYSTSVKGFTTTTAPAARDAIRLYRRCVLPKPLWLPSHLARFSNDWDVFGLDELVAIDNGMDLIAEATILMFILTGVIVLRMPPRRGDLKGTIERTQQSFETQLISTLPGYICKEFVGFSEKYKRQRAAAKVKARLTVKEYEEKLVQHILEHNSAPHPRLRKPRIQVWRDGQHYAPLVLPTGDLQLRTIFALTYSVLLTREGVRVERMQFNSPELHTAFRTYTGKVFVKVDPDDIRAVLVLIPEYLAPIEAFLTTFEIDFPVTLELFRIVIARLEASGLPVDDEATPITNVFLTELNSLQTATPRRTPGKRLSSDAQAATHAAQIPTPLLAPEPSRPQRTLDELLKDSFGEDCQ